MDIEYSGACTRTELICSGRSIENRLRQKGYIPKNSVLAACHDGDIQKVTCMDLAEAVKAGDSFAVDELDRIAGTFSLSLANILASQGADTVVIGGGVAKMGDILFDRIRRFTDERAFIANKGHYRILPSYFLDDAVLVGALLVASGKYIEV